MNNHRSRELAARLTLLVVAGDASAIDLSPDDVATANDAGWDMEAAYLHGQRPSVLPGRACTPMTARRIQVSAPLRSALRRGRRAEERLPKAVRMRLASKFDATFQKAVRRADAVVVADALAHSALPAIRDMNPGITVVDGLDGLTETLKARQRFVTTLQRCDMGGSDREPAMVAAEAIPDAPALPWAARDIAPIAALAAHVACKDDGPARRDLRFLAALPGMDLVTTGIHAALLAHECTADTDTRHAAVREVMTAADLFPGPDDVQIAGSLATIGMQLLFDLRLHSAVEHSALVGPEARDELAVLDSTTWRELTQDSPRVSKAPSPEGELTVSLFPGAIPRFAQQVENVLNEDPQVRVRSHQAAKISPDLAWLSLVPSVVTDRLRQSRSLTWHLPQTHPTLNTDVVIADWADRGAMWASHNTGKGCRLIIRAHSIDVLGPWLHLIDWGRVDTLIVVSEPFATTVRSLLGNRLDGVDLRIVENSVDAKRFAGLPTQHIDERHKTLGMIVWGRQVKDPLWAMELLAHLRRSDPEWKLLLIGPDLDVKSQKYNADVRSRLIQDDIRGAVELTGEVRDIPQAASRCGYILSTSLREGFPLGLVEGILAGAVPVVRDWPLLQPVGGATAVVPPAWVADTPAAAAERIQSIHDSGQFRTAQEQARQWALEKTDPAVSARAWNQAVRGI